MKRFFCYLLLMPILALFVSGCDNNDEPGSKTPKMNLYTAGALNPEQVVMTLYSPDPGCLGFWYQILATNHSNELVVKCKDASSLKFDNRISSNGAEYTSSAGSWQAEMIDSNTIKFVFDEVAEDALNDGFYAPVDLVLVGDRNGESVKETITVCRTSYSLPDYLLNAAL